MAFEQKDNSGSLFRNDRKSSDSSPNAKGTAKIDGVTYYVSAWTKKDKNGNPWQSLSFTRKDEDAQQRSKPAATDEDDSDSIPF